MPSISQVTTSPFFKKLRRREAHTHAGRRAGGMIVPARSVDAARQLSDDLRDRVDQMVRIAVLPLLTVDGRGRSPARAGTPPRPRSGMHGPIGVKPSSDLPKYHWLCAVCRLRADTSFTTV